MIRVKNIIVKPNESLIDNIIKKLKIKKENIIKYEIVKESLDARKKDNIHYIYVVDLELNKKVRLNKDISITKKEVYSYKVTGKNKMNYRPVIVGSGPSGLFLAYMLSIEGFKPIIIERGEKVEDRVKTVNEFWKTNNLNTNSNVQFGEGGAGTFSDGKLNTLVKDKNLFQQKVFDIFIENGAPKEIKYVHNPHIGTDILTVVVKNMRNKITSLGGEFRFNTCLTDLVIKNNKIEKAILNEKEEILCDNLFLALGHSARDTFYMLNSHNINMVNKPFAIGIRIMHKQEDINEAQYGKTLMPPASYKLTYKAKNRGVYSFCMCPGGYVVNASSEKNKLAINGMSNYKRNSNVANSAIVVTINEEDYGSELFDGIKYQRFLEEKTYNLSNGLIPVQSYVDFKNNKETKELPFTPKIKGNYELSNLNKLFTKEIKEDIVDAIEDFSKKINNFNKNAIIAAIESRTSSPVRILRNDKFMCNIEGIYPLGEGAGYAGGITTSAMDAVRVFESVIKEYYGVK